MARQFEFVARACERRMFKDPETSREVWRLTGSDKTEIHTYYDICPWSSDGRFIVFSSVETDTVNEAFGHDSMASTEGRVCVVDTEDWSILQVADNALFNFHSGAFCLWQPGVHKIFYRKDLTHSGVVDLDTGEAGIFDGFFRQLSPDGSEFLVTANSPHFGGQGTAIEAMDLQGLNRRSLVTREELYELTPNRDEFKAEDMLLGNTKWSPDGETVLIAMWIYACPGSRRSLYTCNKDGSGAKWLCHFAHHHSWTPDSRRILFNDTYINEGQKGARMFTVDADGSNRQMVIDENIGSHPLFDPQMTRIVDADQRGIYWVNVAEQSVERLATFSAAFNRTHVGVHPHPVWDHQGSQILYNSGESGSGQIYLIPNVV